MNSFQILDNNGLSISLSDLDKSACEFWQVKLDDKHYCSPEKPFVNTDNLEGDELNVAKRKHCLANIMLSNWFDMIGFRISYQGNYTKGWQNVVCSISDCLLSGMMLNANVKDKVQMSNVKYINARIEITLEFMKPYVELIQHWENLGYTPKQIKN